MRCGILADYLLGQGRPSTRCAGHAAFPDTPSPSSKVTGEFSQRLGRFSPRLPNSIMSNNNRERCVCASTAKPSNWCLCNCLYRVECYPGRVCRNQLCAMPAQHAKESEQAQELISPQKNSCDKQVSSWTHISCHTDKNRYYT